MERVKELLTQPSRRASCGNPADLSALLFALPAEGGEGAATADAVLPHLQAGLSDAVHVRRKALLVAEIAAVPDAADRLEAQARLKSQMWQGCDGACAGAALHGPWPHHAERCVQRNLAQGCRYLQA